MDAHNELLSKGYKDADLSEQTVVEWAARKPHEPAVQELLNPFTEEIDEGAYGELAWTIAGYLAKGTPKEAIQKHLADIYGTPKGAKELSERFGRVGRKPEKEASTAKRKKEYDSFDDFEDEE